jgi:hypothetical protein
MGPSDPRVAAAWVFALFTGSYSELRRFALRRSVPGAWRNSTALYGRGRPTVEFLNGAQRVGSSSPSRLSPYLRILA